MASIRVRPPPANIACILISSFKSGINPLLPTVQTRVAHTVHLPHHYCSCRSTNSSHVFTASTCPLCKTRVFKKISACERRDVAEWSSPLLACYTRKPFRVCQPKLHAVPGYPINIVARPLCCAPLCTKATTLGANQRASLTCPKFRHQLYPERVQSLLVTAKGVLPSHKVRTGGSSRTTTTSEGERGASPPH